MWCESQVILRIPVKFRLSQINRGGSHSCPCRQQWNIKFWLSWWLLFFRSTNNWNYSTKCQCTCTSATRSQCKSKFTIKLSSWQGKSISWEQWKFILRYWGKQWRVLSNERLIDFSWKTSCLLKHPHLDIWI